MLYQAEPDVPGATAEVNRLRKIIDARLTAAKVIAKVPAAPKELTKDQQRQALNTEGLDYDMSHHYDMMDLTRFHDLSNLLDL
jgi:hypothetical protein